MRCVLMCWLIVCWKRSTIVCPFCHGQRYVETRYGTKWSMAFVMVARTLSAGTTVTSLWIYRKSEWSFTWRCLTGKSSTSPVVLCRFRQVQCSLSLQKRLSTPLHAGCCYIVLGWLTATWWWSWISFRGCTWPIIFLRWICLTLALGRMSLFSRALWSSCWMLQPISLRRLEFWYCGRVAVLARSRSSEGVSIVRNRLGVKINVLVSSARTTSLLMSVECR